MNKIVRMHKIKSPNNLVHDFLGPRLAQTIRGLFDLLQQIVLDKFKNQINSFIPAEDLDQIDQVFMSQTLIKNLFIEKKSYCN